MKKSLFALAALAASGAAMAQSSVTLFGVVDATYAYGTGSISNKSQLGNSGLNSTRLGFKGVEDLGGGLSASFHLEMGLNNDDGSGTSTNSNNQSTGGVTGLSFNRRSTVSLGGGFGEVRLGRDYTPQFWNVGTFDPFGANGVGTTQTLLSSIGGPTTVRASNSIGYFLPDNLGGFYGQGQFYMGENVSNVASKKDGNGLGLRAGYANGPLDAAVAFSETKFVSGNITSVNFGGKYDLGVAKLLAHYNQDKVAGSNKAVGKGLLVGGLVPLGAGDVRVSYSTYKKDVAGDIDPRSNKLALGYVHNLSKRTALYATYARLSNKGGASASLNGATTAAGKNSNGYDLGIRHSF